MRTLVFIASIWLASQFYQSSDTLPLCFGGELAGITVTPHQIDSTLRYRSPHSSVLSSRIQLFVKGPAEFSTIQSKTPEELLKSGDLAWHDVSTASEIPDGALSVWTFNGNSNEFAVGKEFQLKSTGLGELQVPIKTPSHWISAITFLDSDADSTQHPNRCLVYIENQQSTELQIQQLRLWLPKSNDTWQTLWPQPEIPCPSTIAANEKGFIDVVTPELPLTYAAIEVQTSTGSLWAHLRIKREQFDISGGWVFDSKGKWQEATETDPLTGKSRNSFLDLLSSLHINTAHYEQAAGYSDNEALTERNPLKRFAKLWPTETWDNDTQLSKVHAVEFLGEPQYGGGRPVPPQEVFDAFLPYKKSKLPTSVTHSEERIWRFYAGLSDYPHFDAYRVVAPAADSWRSYDRWNGQKISWGAPLETIGNLCRSLRELNRPLPCAVWSQGPHDGWGGGFSLTKRRARRSPNPAELRAQALHALASRITSLYWFNLSKSSLEKFPDTWEPMRRIGREIKMLEEFYLTGDAYRFQTLKNAAGEPDWELSSIIAPRGMLLFAIDTAYQIDTEKQEFVFGPPREARFSFTIPQWLNGPFEIRRVDADGIHPIAWQQTDNTVHITDVASADRIYMLAKNLDLFETIEASRQRAMDHEQIYLNSVMKPDTP